MSTMEANNVTIPRVSQSNSKTLNKALRLRGLVPSVGLLSLRKQCIEYNSKLTDSVSSSSSVDIHTSGLSSETESIVSLSHTTATSVNELSNVDIDPKSTSSSDLMERPRQLRPLHCATNFASWPVKHFVGKSDVREFFTRLEELAASRNYPIELLSSSLPEFVADRALTFHRASNFSGKSWTAIKAAYVKRFDSPDANSLRRVEILTATQQPLESAGDFISRIVILNQSLESPLRASDIIKSIKRGLDQRYATAIVARRPSSLQEIEELCTELETITVSVPKPSFKNPPPVVVRPQNPTQFRKPLTPSIKCYQCGRMGHVARLCRTNPRPTVAPVNRARLPRSTKSSNVSMPDLSRPPPLMKQKNL
jgi:hypothetical protein